jgi:hypothetical protein
MGPPPPRAPAASRLPGPSGRPSGLPPPLHNPHHLPPSRIPEAPGRPHRAAAAPAATGKPPRSPMARTAAAKLPPRSPAAAARKTTSRMVQDVRHDHAFAHPLPGGEPARLFHVSVLLCPLLSEIIPHFVNLALRMPFILQVQQTMPCTIVMKLAWTLCLLSIALAQLLSTPLGTCSHRGTCPRRWASSSVDDHYNEKMVCKLSKKRMLLICLACCH